MYNYSYEYRRVERINEKEKAIAGVLTGLFACSFTLATLALLVMVALVQYA